MYAQVADDFGTRTPGGEKEPPQDDFDVPFQALLTENLSEEILYGYGDPGALRVGDLYYVVVTSNDAPQSFPIVRSSDVRTWTHVGFVFPGAHKPAWAAPPHEGGEYWAPELHSVGDEFVVCFTAREKDHSLSIGLARSKSPEGPFGADAEPLVRGGVIDGNLFVDDDGSAIVCWKHDTNDLWPSLLCALVDRRPEIVDALFGDPRDAATAHLNARLYQWANQLPP
ncbi:MAG: family 43 glycosylhydrolase, partial [Myxococcales bacterium]|nr:family 43 glycosylhydrolase [Myxococcales bacterium]